MTLTIERLVTRGKIPRQLRIDSALIDRVAREQFAAECTRQLGRPWPVQPQVTRIRRLCVRVTITPAQLRPDTLAAAWTAAFIRELFAALAHPNGVEIVRFESRAEYLAAAIRDLLNGVTARRWVYEEFERSSSLSNAEAALALFERESSEIVSTLLILENWGSLDRLLAVWDEAALERFFRVIACENGIQEERLSIENLIHVAGLLLRRRSLLDALDSPGGADLAERKFALKLFLGLAHESDWRNARITSPQTISRALRVLDALLRLHESLAAARGRLRLPGHTLTDAAGRSADSFVTALLDELRSFAGSGTCQSLLIEFWNMIATATGASRTAFTELLVELTSIVSSDTDRHQITEFWNIIATGSSDRRTALAELFEELMSVTGSGNGASHATEFRWISTECAGLFLLIRIVEKLGWADRLCRLSFSAAYGPRLLTYTLAGLASSILERFDEAPAYLDPGLALFSGWVDAPDLGGLRRFLASEPLQMRHDLLVELLGEQVTGEGPINWKAYFDSLATHVIREFTGRICGFGRSSRSFIVKNFLALPGRIRVEETRLIVVFTACPLNVVLHMSGLDDPVEAVSWLGGRRIEFQTNSL